MLSILMLKEKRDEIKTRLAKKGYNGDEIDRAISFDEERRELISRIEALKAERNTTSREAGKIKKDGEDISDITVRMKTIGDEITKGDRKIAEIEEKLNDCLLRIPNLPHESVPVGIDDSSNRIERYVGEKQKFTFNPKGHDEIGESLGILDFARAAKISGARFVIYKGMGAALERALITYMLDLHVKKHGYTEILPPYLVKPSALFGTGNLPKFEEDLFKIANTDFYLIPTAEVPVTNIHCNEILSESALPLSYCAFTPCFRSEAGSYGKDTKGMIRQHQFHKVELVKFTTPDRSYKDLDILLSDAEDVLKGLGLHYRVVALSSGDMSFSSAKTFDIEVYLPSQGLYREISSCSNFEDFQARRANIRYKPSSGGKPRLVHTLNGSGIAVGRTFVAILEQFQMEDGSVQIPEVLRNYLEKDIIRRA